MADRGRGLVAGQQHQGTGVGRFRSDLAGPRASVWAEGAARRRRRGVEREDIVLETVYRDAGTACVLHRLLKGRTGGPVFVTRRRPGPNTVVGPRDMCPDTGLARLSYGQARALLDRHTTTDGPGSGRDLHEYRYSGPNHLGQAGASLLMAESRHRKAENLRRCFHLTAEAIAEPVGLLAPGDHRR